MVALEVVRVLDPPDDVGSVASTVAVGSMPSSRAISPMHAPGVAMVATATSPLRTRIAPVTST